MAHIIFWALALTAGYCGLTWLFLAIISFRTGRDVETETFHLGLCFILSIGFLGMIFGGG